MFAKDFTVDYLKFTALESGTITLTIGNNVATSTLSYIEYSIDEGETWTKTDNVASTTVTITTPTLSTGDTVLWRGSGGGTASRNTTTDSGYRSTFSSTCRCNVSGILTTIVGIKKPILTDLDTYAFKGMFYGMSKLVDASGLTISGMKNYMCYYMFYNCTALTSPPQLLGLSDYNSAYSYCYAYMFRGCSSLTSAPNLPATKLYESCYSYMFYGCTSLSSVPNSLPATTLANYCYGYMFYGCTSLVSAPELPATTLGSGNYTSMFQNCSSLTYIKADFGGSPTYCNENWASGIASEGTFIKSPNLNAFYPVSPNLFSPINVPYGWIVSSSVTIGTVNASGVFTTTPATWVDLIHLTNKTLYLTFNDVEFVGTVSSSYNYTGVSGDKTLSMETTVTYDSSRVPTAVSVKYTIQNMSISANDVINYSYYGAD